MHTRNSYIFLYVSALWRCRYWSIVFVHSAICHVAVTSWQVHMAIVISSANTMLQLLRCINKRGDPRALKCKILWQNILATGPTQRFSSHLRLPTALPSLKIQSASHWSTILFFNKRSLKRTLFKRKELFRIFNAVLHSVRSSLVIFLKLRPPSCHSVKM